MKKLAIFALILAVLAGTAMAQWDFDDDDWGDWGDWEDDDWGGGGWGFFLPSVLHGAFYQADEGFYAGGYFGGYSLADIDMMGLNVNPFFGYKFLPVEGLTLAVEANVPVTNIGADEGDVYFGLDLNLGVSYALEAGPGSLYFGLDFPMAIYDSGTEEALNYVGLDISVGYEMEAFGFEVCIPNILFKNDKVFGDSDAEFFEDFIYLTGWFNVMENLRVGAMFGLPFLIEDGMEWFGVMVAPQAKFDINENLSVFGAIPVGGIGSEDDITFGVFAGVVYKM